MFKSRANKVIWLLVTILVPILGPILYFIIGISSKILPEKSNETMSEANDSNDNLENE